MYINGFFGSYRRVILLVNCVCLVANFFSSFIVCRTIFSILKMTTNFYDDCLMYNSFSYFLYFSGHIALCPVIWRVSVLVLRKKHIDMLDIF